MRHVHRHPKGRGQPREHPDDARHFCDDVWAAHVGEINSIDEL